ncbi:biofilm regulation protein phosphatase SiaA [Chitinimonas koreensis]|uniref:biofilm regulation protein phosphatase SiaA n=2 Tax=Chitinimonas koreensis TaxID=356302 RepID=UPI0004910103|nr:biofilm regulation protein phosphatase SiaA [Chitinimonas koreensis]QNM95884.1 SpoIIE family protein phosphatase [Chitinimonas koreensis]
MAAWSMGLRSKSLLALAFACLVALVCAGLIGWQVVENVREHFGLAYARNYTQLNRQKILAPVSRELALSLRLADSEVVRQWLLDEDDAGKRALFFKEVEGYRRDFLDHSWFVIADPTRHYYFDDGKGDRGAAMQAPRYTLRTDEKNDAWYFATLRNTGHFNINVDYDHALNVTKVWINVLVRDGSRKIGLAGTGIDLTRFLADFIRHDEAGVTPMILDRQGAIQAHPDASLIALNSATGAAVQQRTVFDQLPLAADRHALRTAMQAAETRPGEVETAWVELGGRRQLLALSYIPELKWQVLTAVDLHAARVIDTNWIWPVVAAFAAMMALLLVGFGLAVERLVLRPLRRLQQSAGAIAAGHYEVALPAAGNDEIGALSRAFGVMADTVRRHTAELEHKVRERTAALEAANQAMAAAHKKIDDSIDYASLIQRAILPDHQLVQTLGPHHFVLWRPRDVVGGDFYVFRADGDNCLLGVVDCAGHGVPGALMTMLARAAIDHAIAEVGLRSPAAVLARTDAAMRAMLADAELPRGIATNMDAGFCYIDRAAGTLRFAGAKISLYWSDGQDMGELRGGRRALADKRVGEYADAELELAAGRTFYLVTDGFLDQAGGEHGFGFGNRRFAEMLRQHAGLPLERQAEAFDAALADYQGALPQRDDVTLLSFRFD